MRVCMWTHVFEDVITILLIISSDHRLLPNLLSFVPISIPVVICFFSGVACFARCSYGCCKTTTYPRTNLSTYRPVSQNQSSFPLSAYQGYQHQAYQKSSEPATMAVVVLVVE
eukprot:m.192455 g.192455  ORF g.192455 m.192455 type:complete len:113 (+) comp25739_c0_seq20:2725-3063(+)